MRLFALPIFLSLVALASFVVHGDSVLSWTLGAGWLAVTVGAIRATESGARARQWLAARPTWQVDAGVGLAIVIACVVTLPDLFGGHAPMEQDHTVHFFRVMQLRDFLSSGRVFGWSHRWFAGYPVNYLYPLGADLWVLLVWLGTFGLMTMKSAYAVAFALFWAFQAWTAYRVGRTFFGVGVGLLTASFCLLDNGAFRFGGWVFASEWGVWPNSLGMAFGLLAASFVPDVVAGRSRAVMGFSVALALAIVTHPLQLIHAVFLGGMAALAYLTSDEERRLEGIVRLALASLAGVAMSSVWLVPFLAYKRQAQGYGALWANAYDMGEQVLDGTLLVGTWPLLTVLGIVGAALLARHKRPPGVVVGLMTLIPGAVAATTFLAELHLPSLSSTFSYLQYQRFAFLLKPYLFLSAGVVLTSLWDAFRPAASPLRTWILTVATFPVVIGIGTWVDTHTPRQLTFESAADTEAKREVAQWLNDRWEHDGQLFYRVELRADRHDHRLVDLGAYLKMPAYKSGYTPAETFKLKMEGYAPETLRALNVRYVVSRKTLGGQYAERASYGDLRIYEYTGWNRSPFEVRGTGEVKLLSWDDETISFVAGPDASGHVRVNVSTFPLWTATRDGVAVNLDVTPLANVPNTGFIGLELKPGTYTLRFERGTPEYLGLGLFILGCGLLILLVRREDVWLDRVQPVLARAGRFDALGGAIIVGFASVVLVGLGFRIAPLPNVTTEGERVFDAQRALSTASITQSGEACGSLFGSTVCKHATHPTVFSTVAEVGNELRECVAVSTKAATALKFPNLPQGWYAGWLAIEDTIDTDDLVELRVTAPGLEPMPLQVGPHRRLAGFGWRNSTVGDLTLEIEPAPKTRYVCFQVQGFDRPITVDTPNETPAARVEPRGVASYLNGVVLEEVKLERPEGAPTSLGVAVRFSVDRRLHERTTTGVRAEDNPTKFGVPDKRFEWTPTSHWSPGTAIWRHFLIEDVAPGAAIWFTMSENDTAQLPIGAQDPSVRLGTAP